jgi:hypothetical protein
MTYVINCKEVIGVPKGDGTGPMGTGPITGRGLGVCTGTNAVRYGTGLGLGLGLGLACRRGFRRWLGRDFGIEEITPETKKGLLQNQKAVLEKRLDAINNKLEDL